MLFWRRFMFAYNFLQMTEKWEVGERRRGSFYRTSDSASRERLYLTYGLLSDALLHVVLKIAIYCIIKNHAGEFYAIFLDPSQCVH